MENRVYHTRTKHIDVRFHSVREILEEGDLVLEKIQTKENLADMLTKMISEAKFNYFKELLHIILVG